MISESEGQLSKSELLRLLQIERARRSEDQERITVLEEEVRALRSEVNRLQSMASVNKKLVAEIKQIKAENHMLEEELRSTYRVSRMSLHEHGNGVEKNEAGQNVARPEAPLNSSVREGPVQQPPFAPGESLENQGGNVSADARGANGAQVAATQETVLAKKQHKDGDVASLHDDEDGASPIDGAQLSISEELQRYKELFSRKERQVVALLHRVRVLEDLTADKDEQVRIGKLQIGQLAHLLQHQKTPSSSRH
eukprot:Rmarinus@m.26371